jgi:hypothetical protein
MQPDTPPSDFLAKWPNLEFVKYHRGSDTYTSTCPACGDAGHDSHSGWPDRFTMFLDPPRGGYCRRCGYQELVGNGEKTTPEMKAEWLAKTIARQEARKSEIERVLDGLRREQIWLKYHEQLNEQAMAWWDSKGVPAEIVSLLYLGWCPSKSFWDGEHEFYTPTATIPVFSPGWQIQTLRHRLINPNGGSKYRPDRSGLPASLYYANPKDSPSGQCLIVEGEIKAVVVYSRLGGYDDQAGFSVVGTPGKSFRREILDGIKASCDRVIIALDPDARVQACNTALYIGKAARVVYLPCKPDDFFVEHGGTRAAFEQALKYGRQM